jgi:hypothetical protein
MGDIIKGVASQHFSPPKKYINKRVLEGRIHKKKQDSMFKNYKYIYSIGHTSRRKIGGKRTL